MKFPKGTMVKLTLTTGDAKVCSKISLTNNDLKMETNGTMTLIGSLGSYKQFYVRVNAFIDGLVPFGSNSYKPFYLGCFSRNNGINYFIENMHDASMAINVCISYCRSFGRYFASIRNR